MKEKVKVIFVLKLTHMFNSYVIQIERPKDFELKVPFTIYARDNPSYPIKVNNISIGYLYGTKEMREEREYLSFVIKNSSSRIEQNDIISIQNNEPE
jgi:hypothetical protein